MLTPAGETTAHMAVETGQQARSGPAARALARRRAGVSVVAATIGVAALGMLLVAGTVAAAWEFALPLPIALAVLAMAVALGLGLAAWAGSRTARALEALTREAEALRELDTARRPRVISGIAEVDQLGRAMRQMKQALGLFGIYVPRDLVRQLIAQGAEVRLGGERRQLTVMFTDVESFSAIAENRDPEELMRIASAYFEAVTGELLRNGATIDKYIGDAVMAVWNAPRRDLAHALHGCHAALRTRMVTFDLMRSFGDRGWPPLRTRFGVHSGQAVVGNLGSSDRMSYAAVGSMVNLASRIEGLNKMYGTQILVSEATLRGAGSTVVARPLDLVTPKGLAEPIEIHELIGLAVARDPADAALVADRAMTERLSEWKEMIACYRSRRFDAAAAALVRFDPTPRDAPARLYADRLARLRASPPPPDWSPVIAYLEK
jgi:adenylate cyclase